MVLPSFFVKILRISLSSYFFMCPLVVSAQQDVPTDLPRSVGAARAPKTHEPVIVVGGGLAGLSAALEAYNHGASIFLIDKEKELGGNSAKASSGVSACGTEAQKAMNIEDSTDKFYLDTMAAGDRENDASLVDILVHESAEAIRFLTSYGVDLSDVNLCGGHSVPRLHWVPSPKEGRPLPVGLAIIRALKNKLYALRDENPERITVRLNTSVVGLVTWNEYITGVRYRNEDGKIEEINGKGVILATGGFANDRLASKDDVVDAASFPSLLFEFADDHVSRLPTTNGPFATGDGVKMARGMGAALVGMENIQVHPTAFVDPKNPADQTKFLAAEALRGKGAILLNEKGERFGNELGRRDYLTQRIYENCAKNGHGWHTAYMLMNDVAADAFGRPAFNFYANIKSFFTKVDNVEKLAEHLQCDATKLIATLAEYNKHVADYTSGKKSVRDAFDKTVFPVAFDANKPLYVAKITPAIHYTMGGLKIDRQAYVFSEFMDKPFKGLLAAGEVTGGVHGRNRLAGNSLLECVVFGRIAGRSASRISYAHDEL